MSENQQTTAPNDKPEERGGLFTGVMKLIRGATNDQIPDQVDDAGSNQTSPPDMVPIPNIQSVPSDSGIVDVNILDEAIQRDVRPWLDLVDALRSQGIQDELSLPQIAVMGDQSCGKSSVLEALSGIQFPRGSGLVTRCPVQLVMKRGEKGSRWTARTSVSWHRGAQPKAAGEVRSPDKLRGIIEDLMNTVCNGQANGFSTDCIIVEISAPDCPDLTLMDLPGIVRTAVTGQKESVIREVNGLVESYLNQERTIILAIVPANQDVATVDILERAKKVDPLGVRTIGVLTKPDLIGPGNEEEVLQVLNNTRKPLKLGYVMVKNRNQKQLSQNMSLSEAHKEEMKFFGSHGVWKQVDKSVLGIESLTKRLVALLVVRIQDALPNMKWELQENLNEVEKEMRPLARNAPRTFPERLKTLMQIVTEFSRILRSSVRGEYRDPVLNLHPELRIRSIVDGHFRELQRGVASLNPGFEHPDFLKVLQDELRAHRGRELCGIVNSQYFYIFMLQQVEKFRPLMDKCRNDVCNLVLNVATRLIAQIAPQYPSLVESFQNITTELVDQMAEKLQPELEAIFDKEKNPFTENQDLIAAINQVRFERFDRVLHQVMAEAGDKPADGGDASDTAKLKDWVTLSLGQWYRYSHGANPTSKVEDMSTILQAYWRVSSKRVCDNACMLLETNFLGETPNSLEAQLLTLSQQMTDDSVVNVFKEDAALVSKREFLDLRLARLRAALGKIDEIAPDVVAISRRQPETPMSYQASTTNSTDHYKPSWAMVPGSSSAAPPALPSRAPAARGGLIAEVPKSEPEKAAEAARDGSTAHFVYKTDGDNGGLVYWMGTKRHSTTKFDNPHDAGILTVTSSGMEVGTESLLVSRKRSQCMTLNKPESWICLDLGQNRSLQLSSYSLCSGAEQDGYDMVNWVCEGYDDSIRMWVILNHNMRVSPSRLSSPWGVGTWVVEDMQKSFRFIRLRSTGPNGRAGYALSVCAVELYGKLFSAPEL